MITYLMGVYLKLNLLMAIAFLVWMLVKTFMRVLRIEISHARQLTLARCAFLGLLLAAPILILLNVWAPGWFGGFASSLPGASSVDGLTVIGRLNNTLEQQLVPGNEATALFVLLTVLLFAGLALQLGKLIKQLACLRRIINGSVEWKYIRRIHVLFSPVVNTPFSTRALGKNHVVLPYHLLNSPRNLRLAVKHELQHLRNGDLEWVILLEAVKVLCFWNPAVYLWHNEFDCLQELACDEVLIQNRLVSPKAYGACLLEVASAGRATAFVAASNMVPKFSFLRKNHAQLKRRIIMLANVRNKKHAGLKSLVYGLLISTGFITSTVVVFAADAASGASDALQANRETGEREVHFETPYAPIVIINPDYPVKALDEKLVGWVRVQFDIDESGYVLDPVVLENCGRPVAADPSACMPNDVFDANTLAAIAKWKYSPERPDGAGRKGVQTIIRYELEPEQENDAEAAQ